MLDQAAKLRSMAQKNNKSKIITITSGKGGVGKSNFTVNLGLYLQSIGNKVLIFDADIGMGNDDVLMGISSNGSILDVIYKKKKIEDIIVEGPNGIKLMPGGSGLNRVEELSAFEKEKFVNDISRIDGFDYILMDTGAGISKNVLAFISCCDEVIFLTTPEPTALTDCYSLIKATNHFKIYKKSYVVINKSLDTNEGYEVFYKLQTVASKFLNLELEYLGEILEDSKMLRSVREQVPCILKYPNSIAMTSIKKIGDKLEGKPSLNKTSGIEGMFKKIFNIFS